MNEQNYNTLINQPVGTMPETPLPQAQPQQQNNSMFNNNFFPSLEDEKTNMELNPWNAPTEANNPQGQTPEMPTMSSNPTPEASINPWDVPASNNNSDSLVAQPQNVPNFDFGQQPGSNEYQEVQPTNITNNNPTFNSNDNFQQVQSIDNGITQQTSINNNLDFNQPQNNDNSMQVPQPAEAPAVTNNNFITTEPQNISSNSQQMFTQPEQNNDNSLQAIQPQNNSLPGFIDQQSLNQTTEAPAVTNNNVNEFVPMIRKSISEIDPSGSKIQTSEIDLDNEYQIIIKIPKGNN